MMSRRKRGAFSPTTFLAVLQAILLAAALALVPAQAIAKPSDKDAAPGAAKVAARQLDLVIQPRALVLTVGEAAHLQAKVCAAGNCKPAKDVAWSVKGGAASLAKTDGHKVRVSADAVAAGIVVEATLDGLSAKANLTIKAVPQAAKAAKAAKKNPAEPKASDSDAADPANKVEVVSEIPAPKEPPPTSPPEARQGPGGEIEDRYLDLFTKGQ